MFKVKNKISYFGLEYDHNPIPNAIVVSSTRPQKIIKWVNSYTPVVVDRDDGKQVRRERTAVMCPMNFRLRKDEIFEAMKRNKTDNYQDGKFFVVLDHRMGQFEHPDTVKMKQAELRKAVADDKAKGAALASVGVGTVSEPPVAIPDGPLPDTGDVRGTTESGLEVTDRRREANDPDRDQAVV